MSTQHTPGPFAPATSERDWVEDWSHENGMYQCRCISCQNFFIGYKRRAVCKVCSDTNAIKEALAQPEQEPVAWYDSEEHGSIRWANEWSLDEGTPLYTTPPQRQPLTDEQIMSLCAAEWASHPIEVARVIEAAHGIKE